MARNSSCWLRQGYHAFLYGHKKYDQGSGRKRINEHYGLRSAPSARRVVLWHFFVQIFVHFVDYRWECIFREISTKLLGMPTQIDWSSLTASFCCCRLRAANSSLLVHSAVRSRLPLWVSLRQPPLWVPLPTTPLWVPLPTAPLASLRPVFPPLLPVSSEISSPRPLFSFAPKQTKRSSAWQTTHVVSQDRKLKSTRSEIWNPQVAFNVFSFTLEGYMLYLK